MVGAATAAGAAMAAVRAAARSVVRRADHPVVRPADPEDGMTDLATLAVAAAVVGTADAAAVAAF